MAFRQVHTKAWSDNWFVELPPEGKLLFLYLITNERASISGIYECPLRIMVFETGLDEATVNEQLAGFATAEKAYYDHDAGVVWVRNLRKYHETGSPKVQTKITSDIVQVPECDVLNMYLDAYGIDRVSIGLYTYTSDSDSMSMSDRSVQGKMPTTLTETLPDRMIAALAEVTGMDPYVRAPRTALANAAAQLVPRYKPSEIKGRYGKGGLWYDKDQGHWKGLRGQRPSLTDITMTIGMGPFSESTANGRPGETVEDKQAALADRLEGDDISSRFGSLDY